MIEDDFYATLKSHSGEEVFARVAASEEEDRTMLILHHPVIVSEIKIKKGVVGYKVEPWLKTTSEDMFVMNMDHVVTISESNDMEIIMMYQNFIRQSSKERGNEELLNKEMGYIANVNDAKELLEKLYKLNKPKTNP